MPLLQGVLPRSAPDVQVACGPYHMAVVTANGALFTCGDGLGGKLGHGSFANEHTPRQVQPHLFALA